MLRSNSRMPSVRGLIKIAGAVALGAAATTMFAAPASAWKVGITGKPVCDVKTGTVTVTWTVENDKDFPNWDATFTVLNSTPSGSKLSKTEGTIPGSGSAQIVQTEVPGNTPAAIKVKVVWPDKGYKKGDTKTFESAPVQAPCKKESTPTPSPSASRSHGGGGGGGAASPSPSVPSLPVTGSNVPIYAGSAAGLVGVGSVLFVVARRRRIRFEA